MGYILVSDQLLANLQSQVACITQGPKASCYVPTSSSDTHGVVGQLSFDSNFLYVKINATTWKRASLSSF